MGYCLTGREGKVSAGHAAMRREASVNGEKCEKNILQTTLLQNSDRCVE